MHVSAQLFTAPGGASQHQSSVGVHQWLVPDRASAAGERLPSQIVYTIVVAKSFTFCNLGDIYGEYNCGRQARP